MLEALRTIETEDVYQPPLLAEVGEYAESTHGSGENDPEGPSFFTYWR